MTKSNETSQGDLVDARRRGNWALWISILSGTASVAVLVVVLLTVYNTEKKYAVGAQSFAEIEAGIIRLREERKTLSDQIEQLNRESTEALAKAEEARPAAAALSRDAAARDAAIEGRIKAESERSQIEEKKAELATDVGKLRNVRDNLRDKINTLALSHDADARAAEVMVEARRAAEAAIVDAQKRQAEARDRAKVAEDDARTKRQQAETRRAELARVSADLQSSQIALTNQQNWIAKAKEQRSKLATNIQDQQELLIKLRDQAAADAAHVQQLRNEIKTLADSRTRLRADAEKLKSALSWLEPRVVELGALQEKSGEIRDAYVKARQEERAQELELENNRRETVTLQQQITSRREILADFVARETEARDVLSSAQARAAVARDVLSSAQARAKVAREAQERRQEELKTTEADLTELQRQRDALQAEQSIVFVTVAELTVSRDTLQKNVAELTVSRDTLQKKIAELQKKFDELEVKKRQARETAEPKVE